jgi:regulator of sigma E protease
MFVLQHFSDWFHELAVWAPLGLPAFLFYITVVVFVHEMGHFLMARFFGARIDIFSIGFGPEIFGWKDKRGTRWRVSWLPIGGYVKFAGDADAASTPDRAAAQRMSAAEREGVMAFRPVYQRALVAVAGPFANFVLAVLLFTGIFMVAGHTVQAPIIGKVFADSPAQLAGLRSGDRVVRLDGVAIDDFDQLPEIVGLSGGKMLDMQVSRDGQIVQVTVTPHLTQTRDVFGDGEKRMTIGVTSDPKAPLITTNYNPVQAFGAACTRTGDIVRLSLKGIGQLVTGRASLEQLRGPVGIAQITRKVALFGLLPFISLVAVLSVSIGLINLFPIPLLDGGHLLYYACEAVLGRPLGERAQDVGFRLGLVLVLGLMLLATWNDLARLNLF